MDVEGLSVVCAGLGVADEDETGAVVGYAKGQYCLDNLKDLQRFLRRDDPRSREVFQQVCRWNAAALHLVPMIEFCQAEQKLVVNAVKVLVFLTMPIDPASDNVCQQIEHLWSLKAAIARNETIAVIMSLLEDPLEDLERGAFAEDDWKLVQLVLTLFRNVLAIQEITPEQKASGFASQLICLRDKFLEVMFSENVMDLILILAQHINESCGYLHQDIFLILEIFYYILVNHDLELVASSSQKDDEGNEIGKMSLKSLESLIEEEEEKKRLNWLRNFDCSSQFQGTFTCLAVDGSKLMLKGTPTASCGKALLKAHKTPKGSIRRVAWNHENIYLPNQKILKLLCNFVKQFISGAYNVLMQSIQDEIERDHHAIETGDVNIFFKVAHFITAFQHHKFSVLKDTITLSELHNSPRSGSDNTLFHGDICGPLAATMNEAMFLLVISQWRDAFEGLKQTNDYKSLSAAGSIMKDMIRMLALVLRLSPEDSTEPQTVRILLYKLFYDQTDQGFTQFLVMLIRSFDFKKQPKSDLADLVEILSTVLQLMEHLQTRGTLRVSKKSRNTRKKHLSNVSVTGTESMKEPQADTQLVDNECQKDLLNSVEIINGSKSECLDQNLRIDQKEETLPQNVDEEVQLLADRVPTCGAALSMDDGFSFFSFAANSSSLNAFESVSRVIKVGPGQCMDTTLRLDSPGSSRMHISSPKGIKRKWGDNGIMGLDKKSSLALGLGHSPSSSDSKGSSATVCTLSSAKEMDEDSSMDLNLNFHLHLGSENSPSSKKSAVPASKTFEMGSKYNLELSLSTRQSESDITSITPNSANCPDIVDASPTLDQGLPSWMLESSLPTSGTHYGYEPTSLKNDPSQMLSSISSTVISAPKSSVTYTSGLSSPTQPQRSSSSKNCRFKGCTKGARGASGLCIAHGGGRRCQRPGCPKGAEGRTVYCKAHGGGRRCQFLGCTKSAEGKTDLCIAHGGGRRCSQEGCTRAARGKSGLCIRHGGGKRCQFENCTKSAEGFSGLCISHGGGRRCQYPACTKGAQGSTMFCKAHGGGKRCTVVGCTKGAEGSTAFCKGHGGGKRCSFQEGGGCPKSVHGGTLYCVAHGGGKRCAIPECTKSARGRTNYCVRHGGGKRCKHEGCGKSAQGSTDFCKAHGGGKRCTWGQWKSDVGGQQCDRFARGKTGLCAAHSALLQDRRVHGGGTVGAAIQNEQPTKSDKMKVVVNEEMQVDAVGGEKWNLDLNGSEHVVGISGSAYLPIANATAARSAVSVSEGRVHGGGLMAALAAGSGLQLERGSSSRP